MYNAKRYSFYGSGQYLNIFDKIWEFTAFLSLCFSELQNKLKLVFACTAHYWPCRKVQHVHLFFFVFQAFKSFRVQYEMRKKQVESLLQPVHKDGKLSVDQAVVKQAWEQVTVRVCASHNIIIVTLLGNTQALVRRRHGTSLSLLFISLFDKSFWWSNRGYFMSTSFSKGFVGAAERVNCHWLLQYEVWSGVKAIHSILNFIKGVGEHTQRGFCLDQHSTPLNYQLSCLPASRV